MISYYQELLNECIDIQEHKRVFNVLNKINKLMKGGKTEMNLGKHTNEAKEIKKLQAKISSKENELQNLKLNFSDILLQIRDLNEGNTYGNEDVIRRKISELCTNTRYELLISKFGCSPKNNRTTNSDQAK